MLSERKNTKIYRGLFFYSRATSIVKKRKIQYVLKNEIG